MRATSLEDALPQLSTSLQRRLAEHLAPRPGFSTVDRLLSELVGTGPRNLRVGEWGEECPHCRSLQPKGYTCRKCGQPLREDVLVWRVRRDAMRRDLVSALRRLQAVGFVRYDAEHAGWVR